MQDEGKARWADRIHKKSFSSSVALVDDPVTPHAAVLSPGASPHMNKADKLKKQIADGAAGPSPPNERKIVDSPGKHLPRGFVVDLSCDAASEAGSAISDQMQTMHQKISVLELHGIGHAELVTEHVSRTLRLSVALEDDNSRALKAGLDEDAKLLQHWCAPYMPAHAFE